MRTPLRRSLVRVHVRLAVLVGVLVLFAFALAPTWAQTAKAQKTDAQIKQEIIAASIANYTGSCPCPYNRDRAGRSCGRRSAYSRPGGAAPLCYEDDVTQKMVEDYRVAHGEKKPATLPAKNKAK